MPARHFLVIAALAFVVSALKGLRMPSRWAATHLSFDYSQGFIRRGLVGELFHLVGGRYLASYQALALISVVLLALVAFVMARTIRRAVAVDPGDAGFRAAVLAFGGSTAVVFLAHEIGYLDHVGLLALLLFVSWSAQTERRWAVFYVAAAIGVVLALVHEATVVMFVPTILLAMVAHIVKLGRGAGQRVPPSRATRQLLAAHAAGAAVIGLAAAASVSAAGTCSPATAEALQLGLGRAANFPLRADAFEALARPMGEALVRQVAWWRAPDHRAGIARAFVVSLPPLVCFLHYMVCFIRRLELGRGSGRLLLALAIGATLAPLSLILVGWDMARWHAISVTTGFACVLVLRLSFRPAPERADESPRVDGPLAVTLGAVALILGLASGYDGFLFDDRVVQWFPFEDQLGAFLRLLARGGFRFVPPH